MDARDAMRTPHWLDAWQGAPEIGAQVIPRLATVMAPWGTTFQGQGGAPQAQPALGGWRSDVAQKNVEALASRFGQCRLPVQGCLGWAAGDDAPWRSAVLSQGPRHVGQGEGGGVRSLGLAHVRPGVGGGRPSVVWSAGPRGARPSGPGRGSRAA